MPYTSKMAQERAQWMTLVEALAHIRSSEKCSSLSAQVQLKRAIGDGDVPVKWADSHGARDKPNTAQLARSQLVLSGPGLAPFGDSLRSLLFLRSAVLAIWPLTGTPKSAQNFKGGPAGRIKEEHGQWMTLVEAIDHIRMIQDCDSMEALRHLKEEVGDGVLRVGWADSTGSKDCPDVRSLRTSQLLLMGTGITLDEKERRYRQLLIDRCDVQNIWRLLGDASPYPEEADALSVGRKPEKKKREPEEIEQVARDVYSESPDHPPNMADAEQEIRVRLPGADRDDIREVLRRKEFADLRNPAGNQPKSRSRKLTQE